MAWHAFDVVPTPPNTIDDLTNPQLAAIGDQYTARENKYTAYLNILTDPLFTGINNVKFHVDWVYSTLDNLQQYSAQLMNGVYDGGNTPPTTQAELVIALDTLVTDPDIVKLSTGQITYAVNEMVIWSKYDGSGDWTYYSTEVTA